MLHQLNVRAVVLKVGIASQSAGGLVKTQMFGPILRVLDSEGWVWGQGFAFLTNSQMFY